MELTGKSQRWMAGSDILLKMNSHYEHCGLYPLVITTFLAILATCQLGCLA